MLGSRAQEAGEAWRHLSFVLWPGSAPETGDRWAEVWGGAVASSSVVWAPGDTLAALPVGC